MSKIRIVAPNGDAKRLLVWVNGVDVSRMATVREVEPEIVISFVPDRVIMDDRTKAALGLTVEEVEALQTDNVVSEDPAPEAETVGNAPAIEPSAYEFDEELIDEDVSDSTQNQTLGGSQGDSRSQEQ